MAEFGDGFGPSKGSMDDMTFYMRKGKKVVRQKHRRVSDKERTPLAMNHRTRWSNVINAWNVLKNSVKDLFEDDGKGKTDYNWFVQLNVPHMQAYLTQEESHLGGVVVQDFTVSGGSLQPAVEVGERDGLLVSNLKIRRMFSEITEETTVGHFSIMLDGVEGAEYSIDELAYVRLTQKGLGVLDVPTVECFSWRVRRDTRDQRQLLALTGTGNGDDGLVVHEGYLAARVPENSMVAWVVTSHDSRGRKRVSQQTLVGSNSYLKKYTSDEQRFKAVYSYGPVAQYSAIDPRNTVPTYAPDSLMYDPSTPKMVYKQVENEWGGMSTELVPAEEEVPAGSQVLITAQAFPEGSGQVAGGGRFAAGTAVSLLAVPSRGYRFLSWTDGYQLPSRTLTAKADQALTAVFVPEE